MQERDVYIMQLYLHMDIWRGQIRKPVLVKAVLAAMTKTERDSLLGFHSFAMLNVLNVVLYLKKLVPM